MSILEFNYWLKNNKMAFYIYDITFLVLFSLGVGIFLYRKRKNLKREGIMYLYRTQVGIKFIDYVGGRYKKTLKFLSYIIIFCGYVLMVVMLYLLGQLAYIYVKNPEIVRAIKVPPLIPLVPYLPEIFKISFLPPFYFTYWIIAIAVVAIFHEFSHGIFMKRYNIGIKSTGFGFLGPFLAAFVEQDEEQMEKAGKFEQIAVLSAGTFTNLILAVIFFLVLSFFFVLAYHPAGAMFNTYTISAVEIGSMSMIGGMSLNNPSPETLLDVIRKNNLTDDLVLGSNGNSLNLTAVVAERRTYYISIGNLEEQLEIIKENDGGVIALYDDFPAINAGLKGAIIEIDGSKIRTYSDLSEIMKDYKPDDGINIKTKYNGEILEYDLILAEDPNQKGRAIIGIGILGREARFIGKISEFFNFFKEPATNYEPRFNVDLVVFIYNLIWWLALVNISVALVNMLPMGIFDGGRMFMLTMWGISGSKKFGEFMFKLATYFILGILLILMLGWAIAIF